MPPPSGIELRHLRYFLAVFEELHFGRAAERLHIAQPPLSQAIRKLEQELGVELFERTSRAVKATPAATALAEEARKVLADFDFAVSEARKVGRQDAPLRIGCLSFLPMSRLERFLSELKERDASLRTEVTHMWALEQVEALLRGRLDLGVFTRTTLGSNRCRSSPATP
jgi:DNA-binding transcriptional LysR family regulator